MAVPTLISQLSQTALLNSPGGGEAPFPDNDDFLRALSAFVAILRDSGHQWVTSISGTDTITGSVAAGLAAYVAGQKFSFVTAGANTGTAPTVNFNALGAKSITRPDGSSVAVGEIKSGQVVHLVYTGPAMQLMSSTRATTADTATAATTATSATTATTATTASAANAAPGATAFFCRNRLINGNFAIKQDTTHASGASVSAGSYIHDGWKAGSGGGTATWAASGIDTTLTISAGTFVQIIEGTFVEGGTYTLSWSGSAQAQVDGAGFSASPITVTGKAGGSSITVEFNTGTLTRVQFEQGTTATPFERSPFELLRCSRYYWVLPHSIFIPGSNGPGSSWKSCQTIWFPVPMASTPTVSATFSGPINLASQAVSSKSNMGFQITLTSAGAGNFESTYSSGNTADARL